MPTSQNDKDHHEKLQYHRGEDHKADGCRVYSFVNFGRFVGIKKVVAINHVLCDEEDPPERSYQRT